MPVIDVADRVNRLNAMLQPLIGIPADQQMLLLHLAGLLLGYGKVVCKEAESEVRNADR